MIRCSRDFCTQKGWSRTRLLGSRRWGPLGCSSESSQRGIADRVITRGASWGNAGGEGADLLWISWSAWGEPGPFCGFQTRIRGAAVGTPDPLDACENAPGERYNRTELLVGVFDPGRLEANLSYLPRGAVRDLRPPATRASQESAPVQHVFTEGPPLGNRVFRIVHATPPNRQRRLLGLLVSIAIFGTDKGFRCRAKMLPAEAAPQPGSATRWRAR